VAFGGPAQTIREHDDFHRSQGRIGLCHGRGANERAFFNIRHRRLHDGQRRRRMASRAWSSASKKGAQRFLVQALELPLLFSALS
jgi:hypothetical protein